VTQLLLYYNSLGGTIPDSLTNLLQLKDLDLQDNYISGHIPATLGNLVRLQSLQLYDNQLTEDIPDSLGNLSQVQWLDLSFNQLSGRIPGSLGSLSQVQYFGLNYNQLTGPIPESLGNLSQVLELNLNDNQLSGRIPASLGNLSQLTALYLRYNLLTGSIPVSFAGLRNLGALALHMNQLSGSIPDNLTNLHQLTYLNLSGNQLSGSIPDSLGNLSRLGYLDLDSNQLSGTIPDFSALRRAIIDVSINYLDVAMGSQSIWNVDAMATAGNNVIYLPQSSGSPPTGVLQVTIAPPAVVTAGARWQVDGGAFQDSGATVSDLVVGNHLLSFSAVSDWITAADQTVAISDGMTTAAIGVYTPPFIYTTNSGAIIVTGYSCSGSVVSIPITIGGFPVTAIGSGAFSNCTNLLMVTIPGSVASIEGSAFSGCPQLKIVFFEGNAPSAESSLFFGDANVTVYYLPGTTGWGSTFCGVGTVLWNPLACGPAAYDNKFGFSIIGTANIPVAIERCTDLAGGAWAIAQSGILTNGLLQFSDQSWTNNPRCFYRLCFPLPVQ
jgi:Leucine-rich repeat (LRR) protein